MTRRRPVPKDWREDNHYLSVESRRHYGVQRGSGYYSRSGGYCSCGERFGTADGNHTMEYADVIDAWNDHVERAYYEDDGREPDGYRIDGGRVIPTDR